MTKINNIFRFLFILTESLLLRRCQKWALMMEMIHCRKPNAQLIWLTVIMTRIYWVIKCWFRLYVKVDHWWKVVSYVSYVLKLYRHRFICDVAVENDHSTASTSRSHCRSIQSKYATASKIINGKTIVTFTCCLCHFKQSEQTVSLFFSFCHHLLKTSVWSLIVVMEGTNHPLGMNY